MKIKLILNPAAGRGKAKKAIPVIKKIFRDRKLGFDMDVTQCPGEASYLSREASSKTFEIIVAVGGDGTINEVASGMMESMGSSPSSSVLGIIPIGMGNDFAQAIGIPSKLEEACLVLFNGVAKEIDVGKVNDKYFFNCLGIGFDAWVSRESRKIKGSFFSRWIYLYALIKMLFRYKAPLVKIDLADKTLNKKALSIAIGNGKRHGGAFLLTPEAELDDGLIDVCIIDDARRLKLLMQVPKILRGTHKGSPYVTTFKTKKLTISSSDLLLAHADGQILESRDYHIEILPKRLSVITSKRKNNGETNQSSKIS